MTIDFWKVPDDVHLLDDRAADLCAWPHGGDLQLRAGLWLLRLPAVEPWGLAV